MENTPNTTDQNVVQQSGGQIPLPNATAVLVLGIISIPTCFCYGIIGLIVGIIALALSSRAKKLYEESPNLYNEISFKNMKAGRICAIIGVILSSLWFIYYIILLVFFGAAIGGLFESFPWESMNF